MKQIAVAILTLRSNPPFSYGKTLPAAINRMVVILLLLILMLSEVLRTYFVMPYPGSQQTETVDFAYWINTHIFWIRLLALGIIGIALVKVFKEGKKWEKILLPLALLGYLVVFVLFNYRFSADKILS